MHDVARVYHQTAGAPVNWRGNVAVLELQPRILHRSLVCRHGRLRRLGSRSLALVFFFCHVVFFHQAGISCRFRFSVALICLVASEIRLRLLKRRLIWPRIDGEQHLPFADVVAFAEPDTL